MSNSINCSSCGASNQLPEGKYSMFCAFCGISIQQQTKESSTGESAIKSKPKITEQKVEIRHGEPNTRFWYGVTSFTAEKRRVDGGFEYWTGNNWTFVKDEEHITSKGGELLLSNRGIKSLNEVIQWFSDSELMEVRILDLSNNKINNFDELQIFKNVEKVNLSNNIINKFPSSLNLKKLVSIDLNGNPIPSNQTFENYTLLGGVEIIIDNGFLIAKPEKVKCSICGFEIRKTTYNRYDKQCKKCYDGASDRRRDSFLNDPNLREAFYKEPSFLQYCGRAMGANCFIATATMGSYEHPTVMELRYFRDNWILQKSWGEGFVKWYYHYGAIVAKVIEKSFVLKKISYLLIVKPLVYLARIVKI